MSDAHAPPFTYERYRPYQRLFEIGFWVLSAVIAATGNSITVEMEMTRAGLAHHPMEPIIWEWSSNLVLLALVPALAWFTRRHPLHLDTGRREFPRYLGASLVFSLVHVLAMVAVRKLVYSAAGASYDFGPWPRQLFYEYLKDVRTFAQWVLMIEGYRLLLRRLQGEASLLDVPDEGPPVEPVERPERFLVRKLGKEFLLAANDIEFLQASGNYVNLHVRGRDYPLRATMAGIEPRMDPARFIRVHRSYMVNLDCLAEIEPLDTGDARLVMRDGTKLPCSRRYRSALKR